MISILKYIWRSGGSVAVVAAMALVVTACGGRKEWRTNSGAVWNTLYNISYESERDMSDSIQAMFRQVENSLSPFNDHSLISRINRGETDSVDRLLTHVFDISQKVASQTGGRFDPTVSPIVNLWKFGYTGKVDADSVWEPSQAEIDSVMGSVGILSCSISDGRIIKKSPQTEFNFSAVTKGYACDLIADMLRRNGVENLIVEIGGEIAVGGKSPSGGLWRVQIDRPVFNDSIIVHETDRVIEVTDCGIATSGNYRNYHSSHRGKVGHTISPLTGMPVMIDLLSVTVVAPTCGEADAYATAAMASDGSAEADSLLKAASLEYYLITE